MERPDSDLRANMESGERESLEILWEGACENDEQKRRDLITQLKRSDENINRLVVSRLQSIDTRALEFVYQAFFVYIDSLVSAMAQGLASEERQVQLERTKLVDAFFIDFAKNVSTLDSSVSLKCQIYLRLLKFLRSNGLLSAGHELGMSSEDGLQGKEKQPIEVTVLGVGSLSRAKRYSGEGFERRTEPLRLSESLKRLGRENPELFRVLSLHYFGRRGYKDLCRDLGYHSAAVLGENLLLGLRFLNNLD